MIIDGALQFTGTAGSVSADSPTTGTQVSNNVLDLLNARDLGIGDDPALKIIVEVTTAFTVGTSLQVNVQGAPDNGSGSPGSYTTMIAGPVIAEANLIVGAYVLAVDMPRIAGAGPNGPGSSQALPRFLRLQYVTVGTHSTGAVYGAIVLDRQDQIAYPAGITIAN